MLHLQYSALPAAAVITPRVCKAPCRASNPRLSYGQINVGVLPWHHGRIRLLAGGAIVGERPQATICLSTLTQAQARRSRHEDDSVEFDDDNSWQGQVFLTGHWHTQPAADCTQPVCPLSVHCALCAGTWKSWVGPFNCRTCPASSKRIERKID